MAGKRSYHKRYRKRYTKMYSSPSLAYPKSGLGYATFYVRYQEPILPTDAVIVYPVSALEFWPSIGALGAYFTQFKIVSQYTKFIPNSNMLLNNTGLTGQSISTCSTHNPNWMTGGAMTIGTMEQNLDYRVFNCSQNNSQVICAKWKANRSNPVENTYYGINQPTDPDKIGGIMLGFQFTGDIGEGVEIGNVHTTWKIQCFGQGVISLT